ncbi:acyl carrier protein [Mucisphaera sp.]|uniref:acyl carrier protein n=1 Tax=Mucisphaera sp. TaxID=2913024 RepID=UPI003D1187E9
MAMSTDEVFDKVREVLEDALGVDPDEVTPEATLGPDLGAESIDYLDIAFRLEKAFGIKIDQAEMMPSDVLSDAKYVQDGKVTDAGLAELKAKMPHADLTEFEKSRSVDDFNKVFTVDTIVRFVQTKLD